MPIANGTGSVSVGVTWVDKNKIKAVEAGLFSVDGTEVSPFGVENITFAADSDDPTQMCAKYEKSAVPVGSYLLKFFLYADTSKTDLINVYTYAIQVAGDLWTGGVSQITMMNYNWNLTLDPNGGTWRTISIPTSFNEYDVVELPGKRAIRKEDFTFRGWTKRKDDDTGTLYKSWAPGEMTGDVTLYANWGKLRDVVLVYLNCNTGDDANDGLDSTRPVKTLSRAIDIIKNEYTDARVKITVSAAYTLKAGEEKLLDLIDSFDVPVIIQRDQNVSGNLFVIDSQNLSDNNLTFTNVTIDGNKDNVTVNGSSLISLVGSSTKSVTLTLGTDVTLKNNKSSGVNVNTYAKLIITSGSEISGNNSTGQGGIYSSGSVEIEGGKVSGNGGAGIYNYGGTLTVTG